jgi:hypothetical protein
MFHQNETDWCSTYSSGHSKALTEQGWKLKSESLLLQFSQLSSKFEAAQSWWECRTRELGRDLQLSRTLIAVWLGLKAKAVIRVTKLFTIFIDLVFRHSITPIIKYRYILNVAQAIPVHSDGERLVGLNGNWTKTHGTFKNKIHKVNLI